MKEGVLFYCDKEGGEFSGDLKNTLEYFEQLISDLIGGDREG